MVIREHRGSFLQLFHQRFQASMKLRYEVQCSLLEVGVQNLRKLKRSKRQPVATFRRKIEALGCCGRIAQGMENCKVGQI